MHQNQATLINVLNFLQEVFISSLICHRIYPGLQTYLQPILEIKPIHKNSTQK